MKMAQPNVAREPSMDEILASIRRIIESNDPPGFGDEPANDYRQADTRHDESDFVDEETIVAEFHAEEERHSVREPRFEPAPPQPAPTQPVAQPALSLADVAARVRAASERHSSTRDAEPADPAPRAIDMPRAESVRPDIASRPETPSRHEFAPRAETPVRQDSPTVTTRMAAVASAHEMPARPAVATETRDADPVVAIAPARPAEEIGSAVSEASLREAPNDAQPSAREIVSLSAAPEASLLSADVGAKVAQSFGALTEALDAGPRRSFDEIAEEMLRPMLREWLDDNLPTLVERLVREEIERVARGPRR